MNNKIVAAALQRVRALRENLVQQEIDSAALDPPLPERDQEVHRGREPAPDRVDPSEDVLEFF